MIIFLSTLWFLQTAKAILFWLYLWQLKEYHMGRFLDHFRTARGKALFFSPLFFLKIILLVISLSLPWQDYGDGFVSILIALYGGEAMLAVKAFLQGKLLRPVFTPKTTVLIGSGFFMPAAVLVFALAFFGENLFPILLIADIFTPLFVSLLVLLFQPFAVLAKRKTIQKAAAKRAKLKHLKVIGITGSYGKTSTKEFLFAMLQKRFKVVKTPEHRNSEIGIAQTILQDVKEDTEIFLCEMGAYGKGGIQLLAGIAKPEIAILCGANEQHLATFGSMENLLSAEGGKELIDSLPLEGVAIFNGDNKYTQQLYEETTLKRKILCNQNLAMAGFGLQADIWSENIRVEPERILFTVCSKNQEHVGFEVRVLGGYNVENILFACAAAQELGMSLQEIAQACTSIGQEQAAMQLKKGIGGLNIIDSTYSANPDGVIAALEYLKVWPGKKVLVMPCLIELGSLSSEVHRRIGRKIGEVCNLAIITTRDRLKELREGAGNEKIWYSEHPREILQKIQSFCRAGDAVLLESRVPQQLIHELIP